MAQPKIYVPAVHSPKPHPEGETPAPQPPGETAAAPPAEHHVDEPGQAPRDYRQAAVEAQYVPAPKPPTLIEILPAEYQTTNPPLIYRLSKVDDPSRPEGRIAISQTYRAKAFSCGLFYKPISRFITEWKEQ